MSVRGNGITRQEILSSIKRHGSMTAEELHRELHISQVAVRQHLGSLEAEGIVEVGVERQGLGRPSHRYRLTPDGDENFPRRYEALANMVLEELRSWQGDDAAQTLFTRRRERQEANLLPRMRDKTLVAKLTELARHQSDLGYMAEVARDETGDLLLIEHNCAVCAVARNHASICCNSEIAFFEHVLGNVEVERETYILDGDHACTFRIRECAAAGDSEAV